MIFFDWIAIVVLVSFFVVIGRSDQRFHRKCETAKQEMMSGHLISAKDKR